MKLSEKEYIEYINKALEKMAELASERENNPEKYKEHYKYTYSMDKITDYLVKGLVTGNDLNTLGDHLEKFGITETDYIDELYVNLKLVRKDVNENSTKEELIALYSSLNEDEKNKFSLNMEVSIRNFIKDNYFEDKEKGPHLAETFKKVFGESFKDYILDDTEYDFMQEFKDSDNPVFKDEIDALKTGNKEYDAMLTDIENNILIKGDASKIKEVHKYSEPMGTASDVYIADKENKIMEKDIQYSSTCQKIRSFIALKPNVPLTLQSETAKKALGKKIPVSSERKAEMLKVYKFLDEAGYLDDKTVTSTTGILKSISSLEKAIHGKNPEEIKKAYEDYKKQDEILSKGIAMANKLNTSILFPSNQGAARVANLPAKFRNDYVGICNLTGFVQIAGLCKQNHLSFMHLMDDPVQGIRDLYTYFQGPNSANYKMLQGLSTAEILNEMNHPGMISIRHIKNQKDIMAMERGAKSFGLLAWEKEEDKIQFLTTFTILQKSLIEPYGNSFGNAIFEYKDETIPEDFIPNLLVCKKEDRDLSLLDSKNFSPLDIKTGNIRQHFDAMEYIKEGHTSACEVALTIKDVYEKIENPQNPRIENSIGVGIMNVVESIEKDRDISKSKSLSKVLKYLRKGEPSSIKESDLDNIRIEAKTAEALSHTPDREELKSSLKDVFDLKKEYDSHTFIGKLLLPSVRRISNTLSSIRTLYEKKGYDMKSYDAMLEKNATVEKVDTFTESIMEMNYQEEYKNPLDIEPELNQENEMENSMDLIKESPEHVLDNEMEVRNN